MGSLVQAHEAVRAPHPAGARDPSSGLLHRARRRRLPGTRPGSGVDYGGTFQETPAKRTTVDRNDEFLDTSRRYDRFRWRLGYAVARATCRTAPLERKTRYAGLPAVWAHVCETEAGKAVGYTAVRSYQLQARRP